MIDDELDRDILRLLQKNGNMTYEEISGLVDRPASTIRDRIKRMEENRVIMGYSAVIDQERIGYSSDAFISADIPAERVSEAFAELFSNERVSEILRISGERRIMFRLRASDNRELVHLIDREIRPLGFANIRIKMVLQPLVRYPGL
ncbi:MAG: Lrp/AsnC family transcriptional regulator [Methanomassiliicoccales archaeon]